MKKYTKKSRRFLNTPNSGCMGAMQWDVVVCAHWDKKKYPDRLILEGNININREAQGHYVNRKADMLPIYRMRDELNAFIEACEQGIEDVRNQKDST